MIELHFRNDRYITPPGTVTDRVEHPFRGETSSIEISIFQEHRYAFFFWNKWTRELKEKTHLDRSPALLTIDWHQDLMWPNDIEKEWLRKLDLNSNRDVALYTWANLTNLNDGQIMAAAYLNLIGNIYVHCRQGTDESRWEDRVFVDMYGNEHVVKKYKSFSKMEEEMLKTNEQKIYFDIDLDYFTIDNPLNGKGKKFTYMRNDEIIEMLRPNRPLISWVFERIEGFTIAIESEHTGGLLKSNKFLSLIDKIYFKPSLFTNYAWNWKKSTQWKFNRSNS